MRVDPRLWEQVRSYADRYLALLCLFSTILALAGLEGEWTLTFRFSLVALSVLLIAYDRLFVAGAALVFISFRSSVGFFVWRRLILLQIGLASGILLLGIVLLSGRLYRAGN